MSIEETIRAEVIAALRSPEGKAALRAALDSAPPAPLPFPGSARKLKIREAATIVSRHPDTLLRAIRKKKLRAHKPAGSREWLIDPKDMQAWTAGEAPGEVDIGAELEKSLRRARGGR